MKPIQGEVRPPEDLDSIFLVKNINFTVYAVSFVTCDNCIDNMKLNNLLYLLTNIQSCLHLGNRNYLKMPSFP